MVGSFSNAITQFQQLQSVSTRLRRKLLGDAGTELVNAVSDHLLVFAGSLYHLESGKHRNLTDSSSATAIASIAADLLQARSSDQKSIKLFLAPSEFVATSTPMPGVSAENLVSALSLQQESLLPAYEEELLLATSARNSENHDTVALWLPKQHLNELFNAFAAEHLLLAAVQPRNLCLTASQSRIHVLDDDGDDLTLVTEQEGVIHAWLPVKKTDLEEEAFSRQWQDTTNPLTNVIEVCDTNPGPYIDSKPVRTTNYCFFPDGAIAARKKVEKSRQLLLAASFLAAVLLVASLPFILQSFEIGMAEARLEAAREMSAEARADQRVVVEFENEWGTINDFPDQQLRLAMFRLQEVLGTERLSSLELNEGLIRIQGSSSEPQAILQRLEQDPLFTEVVFSRATNNSRYYIDLRLATVNFEAYMLRYFPDQS